jgi:hypothetical protein
MGRSLWLCIGKGETALEDTREAVDKLYRPLLTGFGGTAAAAALKHTTPQPSALGLELPANVHLLTLEVGFENRCVGDDSAMQVWSANPISLLLRLAHQVTVYNTRWCKWYTHGFVPSLRTRKAQSCRNL